MMQRTVLLNTKSTSAGTRGAIYQELVPFSLTYPQMGDSLIKGEELFRDQFLETKFVVPAASHALIPRPRLMALLDTCPRRPLTLVSAPAGFGKTTLLSQWVQALPQESIPVAWVSLEEQENDPVRFWSYVLTALDRVQPGLCTDLVTRLRTQPSPALPGVFTTLINRLVQSTQQMFLVLDDYHLITDQAVHTAFASLVEHLPAQLRVVLATRVDPPFPLSRLRARSQLVEVRTEQLSCTDTEVASFVREIMGVELSGNEVQQVGSRMGGWLVGLQMLDLSLQRRAGAFPVQEEVSGRHRHILDYLTEEVLRQQPAARQRFLLRTSILERLTAPLCDAVLEQSGSQQVLEELKRTNVFLLPLDSQRRWYRYHPLFAEALRFWLEREEPEVIEGLHLRASEWYVTDAPQAAGHDSCEEAIRHAVLAHGWQRAADLMEAQTRTPNERKWEPATLRYWLEHLPAEVVRARPRLCFASACVLLPVASSTTVGTWLEAAEAGLATSSTPPGETQAVDGAPRCSAGDSFTDRNRLLQQIAAFRALYTSGIPQDKSGDDSRIPAPRAGCPARGAGNPDLPAWGTGIEWDWAGRAIGVGTLSRGGPGFSCWKRAGAGCPGRGVTCTSKARCSQGGGTDGGKLASLPPLRAACTSTRTTARVAGPVECTRTGGAPTHGTRVHQSGNCPRAYTGDRNHQTAREQYHRKIGGVQSHTSGGSSTFPRLAPLTRVLDTSGRYSRPSINRGSPKERRTCISRSCS